MKTMKNIDAIAEENERRSAVAKVLHDADETTMKKLCHHCRKRRGCGSFCKKEYSWWRDEECVDGLIKWMYQDKEEQNNGQHDD